MHAALGVLLAAITAQAWADVVKREPKVVSVNLEKRTVPKSSSVGPRLRRRQGSLPQEDLSHDASHGTYHLNATVGTPGQLFQFHLDTGSSDVWVPWAGSDICQATPGNCSKGSFDADKSSTFVEQVFPTAFYIAYGDETEINGTYCNESMSFAGIDLQSATFGLALQQVGGPSPDFTPLMGIGFDENESSNNAGRQPQFVYPNTISQLVLQGKINTRAYSIWLSDQERATGDILFGGVDSSKHTGDLTVLPLVNSPSTGIIDAFYVTLADITVTNKAGDVFYSANRSMAALLDTGTSMTRLPVSIVNDITAGFGVVNATDGESSLALAPCDLASADATLDFRLGNVAGGPVISIPLSELLSPLGADSGITFEGGRSACQWIMLPGDDTEVIFGDDFLRQAYITYNIEGKNVAIGSTNQNPGESNVQEIVEAGSIPGATVTASGTPPPTPATFGPGAQVAVYTGEASDIPFPQGTATFSLDFAAIATSSPSGSAAPSSTAGSGSDRIVPSIEKSIVMVIGLSGFRALLGGSLFTFF